ncbi:hypothetical protein K491DRAFT_678674 [Lophiostoma macrostomum CBS 122681]|uniref:Uncharacterized protein n=1 Tax=Lophiostoma macrostomum CBS 122681 TaxID=1314788 RepID=A0A6A6TAY4_9PLEO|nr:hypothetical protein K491DRAFT_678674 [Lophiostoma macrostomum CBS 122681]
MPWFNSLGIDQRKIYVLFALTAIAAHVGAVVLPRNASADVDLADDSPCCGWNEVHRGDSDNPKEMMWDNTHCGGKGDSRFCCPPDQSVPKCRWTGHNDAGVCLGLVCGFADVTIGTLGPGSSLCQSSGNQRACCERHNERTASYGLCEWTDCGKPGDCPSHLPEFIVSSRKGYGGERDAPWSGGCYYDKTHNFCCQMTPPAFQNCKWYKKETNQLPDADCEPSCPSGHVRISQEQGDCKKGEQAFCCAGPAPTPSPSPPQPPPSAEPPQEVKNFIAELDTLDNPDLEAREVAFSSADARDQVHGADVKTDSLKACFDPASVVSAIAPLLSIDRKDFSDVQRQVGDYWDKTLALEYGTETMIAMLAHFKVYNPEADAERIVGNVLNNPLLWVTEIQWHDRIRFEICVSPSSSNAQGSNADGTLDHTNILEPRRIGEFFGLPPTSGGGGGPLPNGDVWGINYPSLRQIMRGIRQASLRLHHARWLPYRGNHRSPSGVILELVYPVTQRPGETNEQDIDNNYDQYQDRRTPQVRRLRGGQPVDDEFIVFHLHLTDTLQFLFPDPQNHSQTAIESITMYHSSYIETFGTDNWGVGGDPNNPEHERGMLNCLSPDTQAQRHVMFSARNSRLNMMPSANNVVDYSDLSWWLEDLYIQGYTRFQGLRLILDGRTFVMNEAYPTEISPRNYIRFRRRLVEPDNLSDLEKIGFNIPFRIVDRDNPVEPRQVTAVPRPTAVRAVLSDDQSSPFHGMAPYS